MRRSPYLRQAMCLFIPSLPRCYLYSATMLQTISFRAIASKCLQLHSRRYIASVLVDSFKRRHNYLRLSLTERCNLRCAYCMPRDGVTLTPRQSCLSFDEIARLTSLFVREWGVTKIRLTGGEPTVSKNLIDVITYCNDNLRQHGLQTLAMTTNGLTLKAKASTYRQAGKLRCLRHLIKVGAMQSS